jgi:hypothetical protein
MSDLRWFRLYLRESWRFALEDLRRGQVADLLVSALVALPLMLILSGIAEPAAIDARQLALWLAATGLVLLLVISPFRIWQAQDMRSAMQQVQIADLECQLADRGGEGVWRELIDGLSRQIERGSDLQRALENGTDPASLQAGQDAWSEAIEEFIRGHLGEAYAAQFRMPPDYTVGTPGGLSASGTECWAAIQARKDAIAAILAEAANKRPADEGPVLKLDAAVSRG